MTKVDFILDSRSKNVDGLYPIKIRIKNNGTHFVLSTGLFTSKRFFVGDPEEVVDRRDRDAVDKNCSLYRLYNKYQAAIESLGDAVDTMSAKDIKEYMRSENKIDKPKAYTFSDAFIDYMKRCEGSRTWETYYYSYKKLSSVHNGKISFVEVDYAFLDNFFSTLTSQGLRINSQSIVFRCMRAVWKYAERMRLVSKELYPFDQFKIVGELKEKEYLPLDKMRELVSLRLDGALAAARDFFILQFFFCGLDPVDLFHMDMQNGAITFRRTKIMGKKPQPTTISIQEEAMRLLNIYGGHQYLLYYAERNNNYMTFKSNVLNDLYTIGKMIGVKLHFRLARYTWATYASMLDVPEEVIGRAMGHQPTSMCGKHYITFDWSRVDRANRCVIDYLLYPERNSRYSENDNNKIQELQDTIARMAKVIEKLTA